MPSIRLPRRLGGRLAILLAMSLVAGGAWAQDLSMGNVNPPRQGTSLAAQQFIDKLAELSGGKIKVAHHHSGALGGEREVAQQIQLGAVDFGPITTAPLSTLVPEMSVFQLPYIFRDYEHVFKALDGSDTIVKYYDGVLDKKGFKLIGFIAAGYRGIYGHGAINSLADVKGKKVRVQEDKILVATFKALGMISTPIAFPEVATALQTKVIDFAEGGVNTFYHNKFYDIVKFVADVRHTHQAVALVMSKAAWQKQDAAGQKAIMDAWAHARDFNRSSSSMRTRRSRRRCARRVLRLPSPTPSRSGPRRRVCTRSSTRRPQARMRARSWMPFWPSNNR